MAGPNDVFLRTPVAANDVQLKDQTLPDGGTIFTINGALTQAAAAQAGVLTERFIVNGALAQAAATLSGLLTERFRLDGALAQSAAVLNGLLTERFILNGALTQAAAVQAGLLAERFIIDGALAQGPAVLSGSLSERYRLDGAIAQAAAALAGQLTVIVGTFTIDGALTQAAAAISGVLDNPSAVVETQHSGLFLDPRRMQPIRGETRLLNRVKVQRHISGHLVQPAATIAGHLSYSDDELVLALTA